MCFPLTSLTWASKGLGEKDCRGDGVRTEGTRRLAALLRRFSDCILHVYIQHMCTCVSFTAWRLPPWPHMHIHKLFIWAASVCVCPYGFVWNSCHVTYSALLSLPRGGRVQDKHLIWLGPCFLVHRRVSSLLNSPDLSCDRHGSLFLCIWMSEGMTEEGFYTSL